MLFCEGQKKRQSKFLRCRAAKGRPAFAIRGFSRAISSFACRNQAAETKEGNTMSETTDTKRIAELNDLCRKAPGVAGKMFITQGIIALPPADQSSNGFPFYYDPTNLASDCAETFQDSDFPFIVICTKHVETSSALLGLGPSDQLNFYDRPESPGLKDEDAVAFSTRLLGILPGFIPGTDCLTVKPATCVDLKLGFDWDDTFTGPLGGNMGGILFTDTSPLGNSGTGGITILDVLGESGSTPAVTEPPSFGILAFGVVLAVSASYRRRKRQDV
jgi:hypothetical protein